MPSYQISAASGFTVARSSSQSSSTGAKPAGALQASTDRFGTPWPSPSASRYQVGAFSAPSSSTRASQSSSSPSQTSNAPGKFEESESSQSAQATYPSLSLSWFPLDPSQFRSTGIAQSSTAPGLMVG